jgi:hypothetical protein
MGQEARAEEEKAKMPNSWPALDGWKEIEKMLANPGLRRSWLNYCGPLLGWGGTLAWLFDGGVRSRGSGTEWLQRLASQFDHSLRSSASFWPPVPTCTGPVFVSDVVYAAEAPHNNGARRWGRLQDEMAIIHTASSTPTAFCTWPIIPWVLMTDSPLASCLNYSSR